MKKLINPNNKHHLHLKKRPYKLNFFKKIKHLFFIKNTLIILIGGAFVFGNAHAEPSVTKLSKSSVEKLDNIMSDKLKKYTTSLCERRFNKTLSEVPIPQKPIDGEFFVQRYDYIDPGTIKKINQQLMKTYTEKNISIYAFELPNFYTSSYRCTQLHVKWYISELVKVWELDNDQHKQDILFLFSKNSDRTSIRLGAGRDIEDEKTAREVLEKLVYKYLNMEFSLAVYDGINGLDAMVRGEELPNPSWSWNKIKTPVFIFIGILFAVGYLTLVVKTYRSNNDYAGSPGFFDTGGDGGGGC